MTCALSARSLPGTGTQAVCVDGGRPEPDWTVCADVVYRIPEPAWYSRMQALRTEPLPPLPERAPQGPAASRLQALWQLRGCLPSSAAPQPSSISAEPAGLQ